MSRSIRALVIVAMLVPVSAVACGENDVEPVSGSTGTTSVPTALLPPINDTGAVIGSVNGPRTDEGIVPQQPSTDEDIASNRGVFSDIDSGAAVTTDVAKNRFEPGVRPVLPATPAPRSSPPPPPPPTPVDKCAEFTLFLSFGTGSAELTPDARVAVRDAYNEFLGEPLRPKAVWVHGHTDARPWSGPGGNQALSEARALSVLNEFYRLGLPLDIATEVIGHAATAPIARGDDPESLALNRRVEVRSYCP